jgi:hypothetical protein
MKAKIYKAEELGVAPDDGKWVAYCETHATLINGETKKSIFGIETEEFCECCSEICSELCGNCKE